MTFTKKEASCERSRIYYWKCDRPSAFQPLQKRPPQEIRFELEELLKTDFPNFTLQPAEGQGNHQTFLLKKGDVVYFVRLEDGPEVDEHLEVESLLLSFLAEAGVRVPKVLWVDVSREKIPFAVQVIEYFQQPDLNYRQKRGELDLLEAARNIGINVALWQQIQTSGFGPFQLSVARKNKRLSGYHTEYASYFYLNLDSHLRLLRQDGLVDKTTTQVIEKLFNSHSDLLRLDAGVLVHKDLALWNILGSPDKPFVFIDWDDAISGDPMDDFSLMGCFHPASVVNQMLIGYSSRANIPTDYRERFWMHMLRNLIVKSVIRSRSGYFNKQDNFFLIPAGGSGDTLKQDTLRRIGIAIEGLQYGKDVDFQ